MITAEDTARRTTGLTNVRISGQTSTVRRRLRKSELRASRPVVGPILKQSVVGGVTPGNTKQKIKKISNS
jgi:hypothetical protein